MGGLAFTGGVVRVAVGVEPIKAGQSEFFDQGHVARDGEVHRINQECFLGFRIGQEVGIGRAFRLEQLAKEGPGGSSSSSAPEVVQGRHHPIQQGRVVEESQVSSFLLPPLQHRLWGHLWVVLPIVNQSHGPRPRIRPARDEKRRRKRGRGGGKEGGSCLEEPTGQGQVEGGVVDWDVESFPSCFLFNGRVACRDSVVWPGVRAEV